jgi:hypothetical protein
LVAPDLQAAPLRSAACRPVNQIVGRQEEGETVGTPIHDRIAFAS